MRDISEHYAEFCDAYEGVSLTPYKDSAGILTIGRGHVSDSTYPFDENTVYTPEMVEKVWRHDLSEAISLANNWLNNPHALDDRVFDMTVDLIFNCGKPRTYIQLLNEGDYDRAKDQLLRWIYVTSGDSRLVNVGLVKRCFGRYMYYLGEDYQPFTPNNCNATSRNIQPLNILIMPLGYQLIPDSKTKFRLQRLA